MLESVSAKKDGRSRLFCLCDLLGLAYDEAVLYIVHGIDEVGSFAGDAAGTGDHGDYSVVAALVYGFLDDALEHGAHEGFVYEGFAYADLALCVQGSQLGAGAGAAGGTVSLALAEDNHVALVGIGAYVVAVEFNQVNSGDVQTGMLDLKVTVDDLHHLHAQLGEIGNGLGVDLVNQAQLVGPKANFYEYSYTYLLSKRAAQKYAGLKGLHELYLTLSYHCQKRKSTDLVPRVVIN